MATEDKAAQMMVQESATLTVAAALATLDAGFVRDPRRAADLAVRTLVTLGWRPPLGKLPDEFRPEYVDD